MSFPKYLTDIFRSNKSGKRPSASTVAKIESVKAQDAEFRRAMDNDRADSYTGLVNTPIPEDFRTQYSASQIAPKPTPPSMAPMPTQAAPPKPGSSAIQRGIAGFLGFVPQGGTRGDAADGWANIGRALMGEESVQKMESDYNQSIAPEKLRRALETGDVEAIKRLDPVVAGQVQGVDETTYTGGRQRQYDEAVAAGDIDAMRRLDPAKADERDIVRREGVTRAARAAAAIGGGDPAKTEAAFASFVDETPGLLSPQERSIYQQGGMPALQAMLVEPASGKDRFLSVAGGVYDMQVQDWVEQPVRPLTEKEQADIDYTRAQISNIYSQISERGKPDQAVTGGFADPAIISNNLANLNAAIERAKDAGAVRGGQPLNAFERYVAGAMAAPGGMDDPGAAGAYAAFFPKRFEALQDIRASVLPLVASLRTLPGMDQARLADTEKEFARLMDVVVNPNSSAAQLDASLNSFMMLFSSVAGVPMGPSAAAPSKVVPKYDDPAIEAEYQAYKAKQTQ